MFYLKKEKEGYYISNDKTKGEFGPFLGAFCKNILHGENLHKIDFEKYSGYKFSLGFTKKRVFILDENGNLEIITFKK